MKFTYGLIVLFALLAVVQGCGSKVKEANEVPIDKALVAETSTETMATKKANYVKASALKEEERNKAAAERLKISTTYKDVNENLVYYKAEVAPSFKGGKDAMREYLKANLKYPAGALERQIEGTVYVDFIISDKGNVSDVVANDVVGEDIDASFKEEAVRVVASMPAWTAGFQHGKAVDTYFSIPIVFELN